MPERALHPQTILSKYVEGGATSYESHRVPGGGEPPSEVATNTSDTEYTDSHADKGATDFKFVLWS